MAAAPNNNNIPGTAGDSTNNLPACPIYPEWPKYHQPQACLLHPNPIHDETHERRRVYERLMASGHGASLVPNQKTVVCPLPQEETGDVLDLNHDGNDSNMNMQGFDTLWMVENTSSAPVVIGWMVNGQAVSPFSPDMAAADDATCRLAPGDWKAIPTFESFVYHVFAVDEQSNSMTNQVVLQHRAGLIPMGQHMPPGVACDASLPDIEPVHPQTAQRADGWQRTATPAPGTRRCNTIDVGFRNMAACPLHVYWAGSQPNLDITGTDSDFTCAEQFKFHLGTKQQTQHFMQDWESATKFEGSYIGHTFVARLASNPSVVVDAVTLEPTKVVDCDERKQQAVVVPEQQQENVAEAVGETIIDAQGEQWEQQNEATAGAAAAAAMADAWAAGGGGAASPLN